PDAHGTDAMLRSNMSVLFFENAASLRGESTMMRNLTGILRIAAVLITAWATSSEACHCRRGLGWAGGCGGARGGGGGGYGWAGGVGRGGAAAATAGTVAAGTTVAAATLAAVGIPAIRPGTVATAGTALAARTADTTLAASVGRPPGWGCGPAWASAVSARGA